MIKVNVFTFNAFSENTYVLVETETKECVLIDPGAYSSQERQMLLDFITKEGLSVKGIWLTHSHIDHVLGLEWAVEKFRVPYYQSEKDVETLRTVPLYAATYFGIPDFKLPTEPAAIIKDHDKLLLGKTSFLVLETPGHAPGHVCLYNEAIGVLGGDVLFAGSIGRTDLPGGDFSILEKSIKEKLYILADITKVYPGHGPATTIGQEKQHNPYVRG